MLKKFKMEDCKSVNIPMDRKCKLRKDDESLEIDKTLYKTMIRILLYVITSRLCIM